MPPRMGVQCPAALTNSVIVCNASESVDAVRDALSTFCHVEVERRDSGEVIVQFGCSREAQGALAADASSLFGPGVSLIPAYNDRPYQDRVLVRVRGGRSDDGR